MPENIVPRELSVDDEFQSLIPPLSYDEYERLEKSIIAEGVRDPIITWNGTIIDGHNRYAICKKHSIGFRTTEREFESRDAAKIWIIENQFGRRNLSKYDRSVLALQLEPLYAAEAKRRMSAGGNSSEVGRQISDNPQRTDEQLAQLAGTSRDTIRKVKVIETEAAKGNETAIEAREAVKSGEKSIHKAYTEIHPRICTICGKPILDGDSYAHDQNKHKACASTETELNRGKRGGRKANRVLTKPQYADDGRRICSICGEPINEGEHYQDKLNWHYQCGLDRMNENQRAYRNPTIGDTNEVLHHDKAELRESLLLVVQDMGGTLQATIGRYETMDVTLKQAEKSRIVKALDALTKAVESIRD